MRIDFPRPEQERELKALWKTAFHDTDAAIGGFWATAYRQDRCRCVTVGGQVAAALYWMDCGFAGQRLAYLYAVATRPDFRGQGLCRRLMADVHSLLRARGYAGAVLSPAEEGLAAMYAGMGYVPCCFAEEFSCAAGEITALRQVRPAEYAALRQALLPREGVSWSREAFSYLFTLSRCYAGEGVLVTEVGDGAFELLGDREKAPGILGALGLPRGRFRVPGGDALQGMFLPLTEAAVAPGYLGLDFG